MKIKRKNREKGGVLIEFALIMPVIIAIYTGFMDIGMILDQRSRVERAAYEGVRYGISIPGLEPVSYSSNAPSTNFPRQSELQTRIQEALSKNVSLTSAVVRTTLVPTGTGNQRPSILTVTIDAQVPAQLPGFRTYSISISQSAPYLFRF